MKGLGDSSDAGGAAERHSTPAHLRFDSAGQDVPRALRADERANLLALLDHQDFPGRDDLRAQVDSALVVGRCDCGCASIDLSVDRNTPAAPEAASPIPNEAEVLSDEGDPIGGVLVFLDKGYLSYLGIYAYDAPIPAFPPVEHLRLVQLSR